MSREEIERLDEQHLATWDSHDPEAFVGMFADDFVWFDWVMPEPIRDREAAKQYFSGWVSAFPDMKTTNVNRVVGDDAVATEIEWIGTNSGPMVMGANEMPATNRSVTGRGTYFARFRDGKIVEFRSHPDVAGVMMQLGMMPAM
jgi:steroid delta-isomerase-like uncharacterized protein